MNERTVAIVRANFDKLSGLPDELDPETPVLMIASVGIGKHVENEIAGAYTSQGAAIDSHDWTNGVPEYLIDLRHTPDWAVIGLELRPRVTGAYSLEDFGMIDPSE